MKRQSMVMFVLLASSQLAFAADGPTVKEVEATYAADKKLCAEEGDSGARMQCLRDAKAVHTKALAEAKALRSEGATKPSPTAQCVDCGKVVDVAVVEKKGEGGALGLIGGGVAGALLGSQVGAGRGNTLATIAGAAGGAYAGKKVEEHVNTSNVWSVRVRFSNGHEQAYEFDHDPQFVAGDPVRKSGGTIVPR